MEKVIELVFFIVKVQRAEGVLLYYFLAIRNADFPCDKKVHKRAHQHFGLVGSGLHLHDGAVNELHQLPEHLV